MKFIDFITKHIKWIFLIISFIVAGIVCFVDKFF